MPSSPNNCYLVIAQHLVLPKKVETDKSKIATNQLLHNAKNPVF